MVAEIQKLEAAARMAMGHFEGQATAGVRPRRGALSHFWRARLLALPPPSGLAALALL